MSSKQLSWRRISQILVVVCLLPTVFLHAGLGAQQPAKIAWIGYLSVLSSSTIAPRTEAFRQGLRALGYVDGTNIVIDSRYADGKPDLLPTRAAKDATVMVPIVMTFDEDPVGSGFIVSLARPGGNITGLSTHYPEISGKQLELLKSVSPNSRGWL